MFYLMIRRPPRSTRTDTLFPYATLFRSFGPHQRRQVLEQLVEGGPLDIALGAAAQLRLQRGVEVRARGFALHPALRIQPRQLVAVALVAIVADAVDHAHREDRHRPGQRELVRSEEHTSELQSLMRISYAVFCLKK